MLQIMNTQTIATMLASMNAADEGSCLSANVLIIVLGSIGESYRPLGRILEARGMSTLNDEKLPGIPAGSTWKIVTLTCAEIHTDTVSIRSMNRRTAQCSICIFLMLAVCLPLWIACNV